MASIPLVLLLLMSSLTLYWAVYTGPLKPEMSNGTFHHFFVPDGDYEDNDDPEQCQMLFKFADRRACGVHHDEDSDSVVREDFIIVKHQIEDAARLLESIGMSISHDLDGEDSYEKFLTGEITQISEAFTSVEKSLLELEVKFKQSQDNDLRGENQLNDYVLKPIYEVKDALRETTDISLGLRDKHELLSLIVRSQGSRLSRLKADYLNV
ncbi:fin bud initiation factor-like [Oncorhynchus clarkii lewisi]|uniref:fin bud initiation factor-like n=1 Tax=Oncorhynchus clarkii lewisi TaxID=490388 RepID=UPI0039B83958